MFNTNLRLQADDLADALIRAEEKHGELFEIAKHTKYGPEVDSIQLALARVLSKAVALASKIERETKNSEPEFRERNSDPFIHRTRRR